MIKVKTRSLALREKRNAEIIKLFHKMEGEVAAKVDYLADKFGVSISTVYNTIRGEVK
jgi:predicted 3-demethylubiquinone-9 3-methyltransferase (glyoxalase superfamily)